LIGNGWLHEAPKNVWPRQWDVRSRSALRKCMFLPAPPQLRELLNANAAAIGISPAAMPSPRPPVPLEEPVYRHDPKKNARMFPAVHPDEMFAKKRAALYAKEKAKLLERPSSQRWFEDPVALGTLLIMFPPIGLAALWSSRRYSTDARWALTVMTGLTMCLAAAIAVAVISLRAS
jgi:hypothetical protein